MKEKFVKDWKFIQDDKEEFQEKEWDDRDWGNVTLPHDWDAKASPCQDAKSGAGGGFARCGIGWYRKHFLLTKRDLQQHLSILFDGIYRNSSVFLNGVNLGGCRYGYTSFEVPIDAAALEGSNVLAVRVDNSLQPESRWYSGSGIYRNVWLIRHPHVHFSLYGIKAAVNELYEENTLASLLLQAECINETNKEEKGSITFTLCDQDGQIASVSSAAVDLIPHEKVIVSVRPMVAHVRLWTCQDPYLYTLTAKLVAGGMKEEERTFVGIRTVQFDAKKGFLINGKQEKIKGVCLHHDGGLTGAAFYKEIWRRRLKKLKNMGCNGIRMSHNPPAPELLDLCDEMGFYVMDEFCDEWLLGKNKTDNYYSDTLSYGYAQSFPLDAEKDLVTMIRRDYSHPCVVLWSLGNEIPEQSSEDGAAIALRLQKICHREDPTRQTTIACDQIGAPLPIRIRNEFMAVPDVVGYNYMGRWKERAGTFCEEDHYANPDRPIIGTENPSAGGIRGDYREADQDNDEYSFTYETASMMHEGLWKYEAAHDFVSGDYVWTGIDYRGEAPWPIRGSTAGALDMAGFEKDTYFYFRSIWNTQEVTLHLLPHWNRLPGEQDGHFRTVVCYTNCEKVSLYLNGRLVGTKGSYECPRHGADKNWDDELHRWHPTTADLHLEWDVPYEPGELHAVGYRSEKPVAEETLVTTGKPYALKATIDSDEEQGTQIDEDSQCMVQVVITAVDNAGLEVPDANCMVSFTMEGNATFVGMDGGDVRDINGTGITQKSMFAGKLLAVFLIDRKEEAIIQFHSDGLEDAIVTL